MTLKKLASWFALAALLAILGIASTRLVSLNAEPRSLRASTERAARDAQRLRSHLNEATLALTEKEAEAEESRKQLKTVQKELRQRQDCTAPYYDSWPHLTLIPNHGPVGTRVILVGDCFLGRFWHDIGGYSVSLLGELNEEGQVAGPGDTHSCELIAFGDDVDWRVNNGRGFGHFTVPASGGCFQSEREAEVVPGSYDVIVGCHTCTVGRFTVTPG